MKKNRKIAICAIGAIVIAGSFFYALPRFAAPPDLSLIAGVIIGVVAYHFVISDNDALLGTDILILLILLAGFIANLIGDFSDKIEDILDWPTGALIIFMFMNIIMRLRKSLKPIKAKE